MGLFPSSCLLPLSTRLVPRSSTQLLGFVAGGGSTQGAVKVLNNLLPPGPNKLQGPLRATQAWSCDSVISHRDKGSFALAAQMKPTSSLSLLSNPIFKIPQMG